jgi:hypothetical protein
MEAAQAEANDFHPRAEETLRNLEAAEDGMMEWMAGISAQPLDSLRAKYDHAGVMASIDREKVAIEQVEAAFNQSLEAASALIAERTKFPE